MEEASMSVKAEQVIVTKNLKKTYKADGIKVEAVRGVDLVIESGEFSAIVGPSGSGKTTFLNIISGLDTPTSGEVWLKGQLLNTLNGWQLSNLRRDNIGFIFQAYNLIPVLTVEENIEYVMMLQGLQKQERHRRVLEILKKVGLEGMEKRFPPKLSGGQQQRVAIARAMVCRPALILADEPTANLDSKTAAGLLNTMRKLNEKSGMTFLFSTHDPMVMDWANRIITLKDGKVYKDEKK
jgi:putative ABC transport system ATP-binding protein